MAITRRRVGSPRRVVRRPSPRRRTARALQSSLVNLPAGELTAVSLGNAGLDAAGLTHLLTWGTVQAWMNTLPPGGTQLVRWAMAARMDTSAIAALPTADLEPLRDFTDATPYQDREWKSRRFISSLHVGSVNVNPVWPSGPGVINESPRFSCRRLGTLDLGEGWFLYVKNNSAVDLDIVLDLETAFMLA